MKLLWHSNSPLAPTGYGSQTALMAPRLAEHHDLYLSSNYGLEGAPIVWNGIPVLPGLGGSHGNETIPGHVGAVFENPREGLLVTLYDAQVFDPQLFAKMNVACWTPVDHNPPPPALVAFFRNSQAIPIAMSRYGEEELAEFDPLYVPHGCFDYDASVSLHPGYREKLGDIVTGRVNTETVVGVDSDGRMIATPIYERMTIPLMDSHALRVRTETGRCLVVTRDNEVMTADGWKPAGSLNTTDSVCTLDVEQFNGTRTELDIGRTESLAGTLRNRGEVDALGDASRPQFRGLQDPSRSSRAAPRWWRQLCEAIAATARTVGHRTGLHRGDPRWGGPHHRHQVESTEHAVSPVHASRGGDESVRSVNPMVGRAHCVDHSRPETNQGRVGLGVSASDCRSRSSASFEAVGSLLGGQETAGGARNRILRDSRASRYGGNALRERDSHRGAGARLESPPPGSYERIVSIEPVRGLSTVYDLKTGTGNFLVDGVLVHNCDTSIYKPTPSDIREQMGVPKDAFIVGMVAANKGRPSRKCFQQAFEAFRAFHQKHEDAYLYVHTTLSPEYAQGEDIPTLLASLEIPEDRVKFPNQYSMIFSPLSSQQMSRIYSSFDVLLNASMGEGFGLAPLEAQACGVPAIVTDFSAMSEVCEAGWKVGGRPYWTGQASWMAVPDVKEIVDALEDCHGLTGPQRHNLSKKAREHALTYDAQTVFDDFMLPALREVEERIGNLAPLKVAA